MVEISYTVVELGLLLLNANFTSRELCKISSSCTHFIHKPCRLEMNGKEGSANFYLAYCTLLVIRIRERPRLFGPARQEMLRCLVFPLPNRKLLITNTLNFS